jgi:hypothetical protein
MTALLTSDFTDYIERKYIKPQDILTAILKMSPTLGILPKDKTMGDYVDLPINYAAPAGVSPSYSTAVTNQAPGAYDKFTVQPVNMYGYGKVDNRLIRSALAKNDKTLILKPLNNEMQRLKEALGVQMSANALGSYGFALGVVGSESTTTCTLATASDHIKFYKNMEICAAATDGTSGSLRDSGDHVTVTGINRSADACVLTSDENWATVINGLVATDYLFAQGGFGAGAYGLADWIPATDPTGSFCGVDRSLDTENLGGWRVDGTGMPIDEAVNYAAGVCAVGGAAPTIMIIHPLDMAAIMNGFKATARPNTVMANGGGAIAKIGYRSIQIDTQLGPIDVLADRFATRGSLLLLNPDSFVVLSCGELIQFLKWDEQGSLFSTTAAGEDSTQFTVLAQWQIGCNAPGKNARIAIS